jgi:hypothetical protein
MGFSGYSAKAASAAPSSIAATAKTETTDKNLFTATPPHKMMCTKPSGFLL